jgi:hypothetical protein
VSVAIGVVAHLDREERAWQLADTVNADSITYDDGTLGCTQNHLRVWSKYAEAPQDWVLVLEDDAVPCPQFRAQLDAALAATPRRIVSLYLGTGNPKHWQERIYQVTREADREDADWIVSQHLLHAVGVAVHADLIPGMVNSIRAAGRARINRNVWPLPIDEAITEWAQDNNHMAAYTWPSLVDHADEGTLVQHPDGNRRHAPRKAWRHGTRDQWNRNAVTLAY